MKIDQSVRFKVRYFFVGFVFLIGLILIIGSGETRYIYRASPRTQTSSNNYFITKISPMCTYLCTAFSLTIENKTNKNIEIDWNKTLYILNGRTSGGFMFEGIVFRDRNNPKPPDIVFANKSFTKTIYPNNLVSFTSGRGGGWEHDGMPSGENGVYLTVKIGNEEISEKITLYISKDKIE